MKRIVIIFSVMMFIIANVGLSQDIINETGKDGKFIVRDAEQQEALVIEDGNVGITGELSVEQMPEGNVSNPYVVWDPNDKKFKTVDRLFSKVSPLSEPLETRSWHSVGYDGVGDDGISASVQGTAASWNRFTTDYGYIQLGPANTTAAHIYTDATHNKFVFNKPVFTTTGEFSAMVPADLFFRTGVTPRMTMKASNGNMGVGTTDPVTKLHIYDETANEGALLIQNSTTGATASGNAIEDGLFMGYSGSNAFLWNYENTDLRFGTNKLTRMTIDAGGTVGIGTEAPNTALLHLKMSGNIYSKGIRFETSAATSEDWYVYMNSNDNLVFNNDASNYFTMQKNNGFFGIGTVTPDYKLEVYNGTINVANPTDNIGFKIDGDEAIWSDGTYFSWGYGGTHNYFAQPVQIGYTGVAPTYKLEVTDDKATGYVAKFENKNTGTSAGGIIIETGPNLAPAQTNDFIRFQDGDGTIEGALQGKNPPGGIELYSVSDERLKSNITNSTISALNIVSDIKVREFEFNESPSQKQIGFIAQELQTVYPQAVSGDPNGDVVEDPMLVANGPLVPILVKAIQELQARIEVLERR